MNIAIYGSGGAGKEVFDLLGETPEERKRSSLSTIRFPAGNTGPAGGFPLKSSGK